MEPLVSHRLRVCKDPEARPAPACALTDVWTEGFVPSVTVETWTLAKKRKLLDRWSVPIAPEPQDGEGDALTLLNDDSRLVFLRLKFLAGA